MRDHEPRLALDGGPDGLDAYRRLAPEILRVLRPGGVFAVEIGAGQAAAVAALFAAAGRRAMIAMHKDLAMRDRVVAGLKKPLGNVAVESLHLNASPPRSVGVEVEAIGRMSRRGRRSGRRREARPGRSLETGNLKRFRTLNRAGTPATQMETAGQPWLSRRATPGDPQQVD